MEGSQKHKLLEKRTRYIVPFIFESGNDYDQTVNKIHSMKEWCLQERSRKKEQDLYKIILDNFHMDERKNNIGCSFVYKLGEETLPSIIYTRFDTDININVKQMGMYLFRTNVGFIWYEADICNNNDLQAMVLLQNEFKELSYERFVYKKKGQRYTFEDSENAEKPILMGHWLKTQVLDRLPVTIQYFAERTDPLDKTLMIPDKTLLFNYIVFDKIDMEELMDNIFYLNNGYNDRYKRTPGFEKNLLEPFKDAYYCATTGGCGYYAVPEGNNVHFYRKTLKEKVMLDYFLMYILCLYQSYSILKFTRDMEERLPADSSIYLTDSKESLVTLKELETNINVFLVKSIYSSVSHISHQNDFYRFIIRQLNISENIEGLTIGLDSLRKLQEGREQERIEKLETEENEERELADNRMNIALGLISILALGSAISDGYGAAEIIGKLFGLSEMVCHGIGMTILILVAIIAVIAIRSVWGAMKRLRKEKDK